MIQEKRFKLKVFTFQAFIKSFLIFHKDIPAMIISIFRRRISRNFESKLMLTVISVNDCKYCAWYHSKAALKSGMEHSEIKRLLSGQLNEQIDYYELTALNFAVHYAETGQKPNQEPLKNLYESYGEKIADEILLKLKMIYFGNLGGNTFKAFLSRMKGNKPENSFWLSELVIFIIFIPLFVPISLLMKR